MDFLAERNHTAKQLEQDKAALTASQQVLQQELKTAQDTVNEQKVGTACELSSVAS